MIHKQVGIILLLLISCNPIMSQTVSERDFLAKQFEIFKHDLHLIKKCYFSRNCSAQEKKDAQTSLFRVSLEGAALATIVWGISFGYKTIATKKALESLASHKATLFKQELSGAVGPDPDISTQFLRTILGTSDVYVPDKFVTAEIGVGAQDILSSSKYDDIPVGRPIYDKKGTLIGGIAIRPMTKKEIGIVLYKAAPAAYHTKINNLRSAIAWTPFDQHVNHWPYIFENKWGLEGTDSNPGSSSASPPRVISQLMNGVGGEMKSYVLINLENK
jgi:hypothetical protein